MARASLVNYELVAAAASRLTAAGVTPTARNVRAELGAGSMGTVLGFLQQWRKAGALAAGTSAISPEVIVAICRHTEKSVKEATAALSHELMDLQTEVGDVVREAGRIEEHAQHLEKILTAAREQNAELHGRLSQMEKELRSTKSDFEKTKASLTRAKAQIESHRNMKAENEKLRTQLTKERERRIVAERKASPGSTRSPRTSSAKVR